MRRRSLLLVITTFIIATAIPADAQDYSRIRFNVGGGVGYPQGDLKSFVNHSGNFVAGGGYNFTRYLGVDTEYFWEDLPIKDQVLQQLNATTQNVRAQQYAWTFNPIVEVPLVKNFGTYVIGGIGWYHRSGQTTTPAVGAVCIPYWSWWYGCTLATTDIVTASRGSSAFGKNIGIGFTYRIRESHLKIYAEARYHEASYNNVPTKLVPITFGVRW
jgi:Outer membrane protein beta-barrel domain